MLDLLNNQTYTVVISALSFGFLSSFHCMGMCGPLLCHASEKKVQHIYYQIGRLISYSILALIIFYFSKSLFDFFSLPVKNVTFFLLIIFYIFIGISMMNNKQHFKSGKQFLSKLYQKFFKKISNQKTNAFLLGLISGLLPCGLLHTFLLGVIPLAHPMVVLLYVGSFWLATTPALWSVNFAFKKTQRLKFFRHPKFIGSFYIVMACYIIYTRMFPSVTSATCH